MADQDPATAHPQPPQMEVPSIRVPDVQFMVQDLAQSRRDLFEERRNSSNRLAEERERSRWEAERLRSEMNAQIKGLERENEALIRAVGRIQGENDHLREENAVLRLTKVNGHVEEKPAPTEKALPQAMSPLRGVKQLEVPLVMPSSPMGAKPSAMQPMSQGFPVMPAQPSQIPPRNV